MCFFPLDNLDNVDMGGGVIIDGGVIIKSRPKAGSDFRIEEFGRRRRPNPDAREARLAQ